jgi:hypothetical protein
MLHCFGADLYSHIQMDFCHHHLNGSGQELYSGAVAVFGGDFFRFVGSGGVPVAVVETCHAAFGYSRG